MKFAKVSLVLLLLVLLSPHSASAASTNLTTNWDATAPACKASLSGAVPSVSSGEDVTINLTNSSSTDEMTISVTQDGSSQPSIAIPAGQGTSHTFSAVKNKLSLSAIASSPTCDNPTSASWSVVTIVSSTSTDSKTPGTAPAPASATAPINPTTTTPTPATNTTTSTKKLADDNGGTIDTTEVVGTKNVSAQKQNMLLMGSIILGAVIFGALGLLFFLVIWPKLRDRKKPKRRW